MHHKSFGVETEKHKELSIGPLRQVTRGQCIIHADENVTMFVIYDAKERLYGIQQVLHPLKRIDRKPSFNTTAIRRRVHKDARTQTCVQKFL